MSTGQPAQFDVMDWDENGVAGESEWQAPVYCFNKSEGIPHTSMDGNPVSLSKARLQ